MEPVRTDQNFACSNWPNQLVNTVNNAVCCENNKGTFIGRLSRSGSFSLFKSKTLSILAVFIITLLSFNSANAQCSFGYSYGGYASGNCNSFRTYAKGPGEFMYFYNYNGLSYTVETCGDSDWDTQITVYQNNNSGNRRAYNDDACGLQSRATYTANYTQYSRVILTKYNCQGWQGYNYASMNLKFRYNNPSTPGTPSGGGTFCASSRTLTRSGSPGSSIVWYWQTSPSGTSTSLGSGSTYTATSSGTYYVRPRTSHGCWGSASGGATVNLQSTSGSAGTYGNGYWYVSCYNGNSYNTYYGYYTQNGYSWDSRNRWGSSSTPSSANGSGGNAYQGCTIPADQHSTISRRRNFACGRYRIDIPNHDDDVYVYVNGSQVYVHNGCCDSHTGVWTGDLNSTSTVAIRHREGGGGSHVGISVVNITATLSGGSISGGGTICTGGNLGSFGNSASASNGSNGYTYQWQSSPNNSTWSNISSATGTTYNPPALTSTTYYRRRVIDGCNNTAYSNTRTITVVADPSISSSGGGTICVGGNRTLSSSTSGGTGSCGYQWQISSNNSTWSNISGATSSTYNTGSLSSTRYYRVVRTCSGSGCGTATSNTQTVTVVADPSISASGGGTICVGGNRTLSSSTSGGTGSCSYQWQSSPNNSTWSNISGATSSTYATGSLSSTTYYRVRRSCNGSGCNDPYSNSVAVTVVADPSITITTANQNICIGGSVTLSSSTSGGTGSCSYQWQSSPNNSTWSNISGATASTYAASPTSLTYYRVVRSCNGSGCNSVTSSSMFISVSPDPSISSVGGGTICVGGNITLLSSTSGGSGSCGYQWQISPNNSTWSNISGATSSTYNTGSLSSTSYYRVVSSCSGSGCGTATSNVQTVTVVPDPSISASGSTTICTGGSANLSSSTSGGTGSCSYQWQSSPNNSTWSNISGATASTYNTGTLTSTTYYRVRRSCNGSGCNDPYSNTLTVTVNPDPTVSIAGGTEICKFASTTLSGSVSGGTGSCSIQWQSSSNGTSGWANVGTGSTFNTGSLSTTTYYRAVYSCSGNGCNTATSNVEQVLIDVTPPTAVCKNISIDLSAGGAATISASDIDGGSTDNCSAVTLSASKTSFNCSDVGNNTVTLTVTDNNGNSATCTATVIVNDVTPPAAFCQNITIDLDSAGSASITAADINNGSNDACGIASMTVSPSSFNCGSTGPNTVTLTVTDNNGNVSTCTSTVTVNDVLIPGVAPNVTCVGLIQASLGNNGIATITPAMLDNGSYDNCGLTLTVSPNTFDCNQIGLHSVTLTGTDPAGNVATCVSKVNIVDITPPDMVCQTITVQLDASGNASITAADVDGGTTDNCGIASLSIDVADFDCSDVGINTVVLTALDVNGNSASCSATVIIEDNVAPAAICQSITLQLDANGVASITPADIDNGSNDACGIASLALDKTDFVCSEVGPNTVELTVTDNNGNISTCTATVTVEDNVAPVITCAANITVNTDPGVCTAVVNVPSPTTSDACGIATTTNDFNGTANASGTYPLGTTTVVFTTTDVNGNSSTCSMTITVVDNEAPTITCPYEPFGLFRPVDAGACYATLTIPAPVTDDNCGVASVTNDFNGTSDASGQYPLGLTTITWTVTDNSGNTSTCEDVILVIDNEAPDAVCKNITLDLNSNGFATIVPGDIDNGSTDNCSISTMTLSQTTFSCANVGPNAVTLIVFDNSGNQSSCTATVTVEDNVDPIALCQNVTLSLDVNGEATLTAGQVNNGSSDACGIASLSVDKTSFTCADLGPNTVTLTVTDNNGNVSTCTSTVTVEDTRDPNAVCNNLTVYLDGNGDANIVGNDVASQSTDNCSIVSMLVNPSSFTCSDLGANPVTVIVTDQSGNDDFCFSTVTVADNTPPTIVCSPDIMVNNDLGVCGAVVNFNITATDNCSVASFGQTAGLAPGSTFPVGVTTVTYDAVDGSGNASTCSFTVTVVDNEVPQLTCSNITVQLDANGLASIVPDDLSTSSDNCGIASKVLSVNSFNCTNVGPNTVVVTVTDVNGNVSSCTSVVTVEDNVAPVALCQSITVQLDANGAASITTADIDNGSNDACGIASLSLDKTSFDCSEVGANTVTLTVTDNNGNASTCTTTVTVEDNVAPNVLCQSITVQLDANGNASITTADIDNGSTDACGIASLALDITSFDCSNVGPNDVKLTATDVNGNEAICNAVVTVEDNVAPVALCQSITLQLDANGVGSITPADIDNGSNDACGIASLSLDKTSFDCSEVGANTVTLTVTDNNGNVSTCTATVTVEDNVDPIALCTDIDAYLDASGNAVITASMIDEGASDACGIIAVAVDQSTFDCTEVGGNNITLTVTDANGNTSTCASVVTVIDTVAPVALCQSITVQLDANGAASITTADIDNGSNDACGIASLALDKTSFDCSEVGANTVTLTVTDNNGNVSTCTATVTVEDNVAPVALCQAVTVQLDANGAGSITTADIDNGSNDACGIASLALDKTSFDCSEVGANTVTLTVTDNNGNVSTCTATVTVEDNVAPVALCKPVTVQLDANGAGSITTADIDNGSNDACGIASLSLDKTSFDCSEVGANTVTLTVTDNNGNVSTCTATVNVEDNVAPVALCQAVTVQLDANGAGSITTADIDNGSNDACGIASLALNKTSFDCTEVGANTVTLTVTDNNGNVSTCTATVTVEDNVAPVALCKPVTVQLDANGAGSITTADIDNGSNDACGIASLALDKTSFDCSEVGANTVTLTVTDNNGNVSTCTATVTVEDNVAPAITCPANITVNNDLGICGALVTYAVPVGTDACATTTTQTDATGLTTGSVFPVGTTTLTYEVVDASGNAVSCSFDVTVIDNEQPLITCPADIYVTADSNDCDPQVFWTAPVPTDNCQVATLTSNFNSGDEFYLGTHTVTYDVADIYGNTNTCSFNIVVTPKPQVLTVSSPTYACGYHVSCNGNTDGSISTYVAGGCLPYTYAWSNGATTADVSGLGAGTYSVTVSTADGQTATESFTITEPDLLTATATPFVYSGGTNISCAGFNDGSIDVSVAGGCAPYTYTWNGIGGFSASTQDVSNLYAGTYKVTIRDANNCSRVLTLTLTEASAIVIDSIVSPTYAGGYNIGCNGSSSGDVDLSVSGAIPPYTYTWSNGATTEDLSSVGAGTYNVTVTDVNGCSTSGSITLTEPPVLAFDACPNQTVVLGYYPQNVAQISTSTGGGVAPYTYAWSTGETGTEITVAPTATTTYSVTITDANGCVMVSTHTVEVKDIRCGGKLEDVTMCDDRGRDKCVKAKDVPRRLSDGWTLGSCGMAIDLDAGTCGNPVIPGCACEYGVASITVTYQGPSGVTINVYGKKNQGDLVATFGNVQNGDELTILATTLSGGRFDKELYFDDGTTEVKVKSDCKYVEVGTTTGSYTIVEYTDIMDNTCNAAVASCECDDNIALLQMVFRGQSGATVRVWEDRALTKLVGEFPNVQQGDTLLVNGTLVQPTGKLNKETYFEIVGSSDPVVVINTDCKAGGTVGRIYGNYFITGYIDKKDNTCNMPTPCPCKGGLAHVGFTYNGPANGTVYAFLESNLQDTLGIFTNLNPGDTIIVSAAGANETKLQQETYLQLANTGDVYEIPTQCKTYIEGQFFGLATVYGYVDEKGTRCHMDDPSACDCVGGLAELDLEYDRFDSNSISNATIYAFSSSTHADTLAVFTNISAGDPLHVSGASLPGGVLNNFTYLQIAGSTGPDIKIPTGCQYPIVGQFVREVYVLAYEDSVGNLCEDDCGIGKTLMCHAPANKAPHTHCVKTRDVAGKLSNPEWTIGACPILKKADDTAIEPVSIEKVKLTAYPNPFNNIATFRFTIPADDHVSLTIYNATGQRVTELFNSEVEGGKEYFVDFDATDVAYGVYYYHFSIKGGKSYNGKLIHIDK